MLNRPTAETRKSEALTPRIGAAPRARHWHSVPCPGTARHWRYVPCPGTARHWHSVPCPGTARHWRYVRVSRRARHWHSVPCPGTARHWRYVPCPGARRRADSSAISTNGRHCDQERRKNTSGDHQRPHLLRGIASAGIRNNPATRQSQIRRAARRQGDIFRRKF